MADINPQKTEIHDATEDALTSLVNRSPEPADVKVVAGRRGGDADLDNPPEPVRQDANAFPPDVKVKRDDSDVGGPIVVETDSSE